MLRIKNWLLLLFFAMGIEATNAQKNVILDADIDSDVDDVAALAMLGKMAVNKQVNFLGIVVTSDDPYAPECADVINTYLGLSSIPVGFEKLQPVLKNHSKYTRQLSENFTHRLHSYRAAEEAVTLYRRLLARSADHSVILVSLGHLTSFRNLLASGPDEHSPLDGKMLAHKKIAKWICMGGQFPAGKEANFYRPDPVSTVYCLREWTRPVVFCGWELGNQVVSGGDALKQLLQVSSPISRAFDLYNHFAGRPSWDQLAVLLLDKRSGKYFDFVRNGYCRVEPDGSNRWVGGKRRNHAYVTIKKTINPQEIVDLIHHMLK